MRVLMTTDTIGGVWTFSKELVRQLLAGGDEVALVSFGREPSREQRVWCSRIQGEFGDAFVYESSAVPLEWMTENVRAYERGEQVLLDMADRFDPEVLHSNQYCFGRLELPIPRVITAHSDVLSWADACRPGGLEDSEWLDRYCELVQEGLDGADCVVAPTASMMEALEAYFTVSSPARVVYNGRTVPRTDYPPHRFLRAISVGRFWDEAKGLTTLLQVKSPIPVMIAGEERFERAATPAQSRLQALGMLDDDALFAAFRSSSIYIAASRYEPFGLAAVEAALCGCAVVARDICSLREVWGDAAVYFRDAEGLERLLAFLAEDRAALRQAQIAAREHARRYTAETMADSYAEIYRGLRRGSGMRRSSGDEEYVAHAA
jgi:glycosyltransferase involved in cell wall biosynthesis